MLDEDVIFPGLDAINPKVALLGPKGGGKTMYRHFLFTDESVFPNFLQTALGVRDLGFRRPAKRISWNAEAKLWEEKNEILTKAEGRHGDYYLPKVSGTTDVTVHRLPMPSLGDEGHAELLDFPGEYWVRDPHEDPDEGVEARDRCVERALQNCKIVLVILPYWLLVPRRFRMIPANHISEVAQRGRIGGIADPDSIDRREEVMMTSLNAWLRRMRRMLNAPRKSRPLILVTFSMLSTSWGDEIKTADDCKAIRELLVEMRGLAVASNLVRSARIPAWTTSFAQPLVHVEAASRLRQVMARLDTRCRDFVTRALELEQRVGAGRQPARKIYDMLVDRPNTDVRFSAMNVVTERAWLLPKPGSNPGLQQYIRMEHAGAMLPLVYLAANLDRLT